MPLAALRRRLPPLTGGGFWPAFAQLAAVYYGSAALLHWVVPALLPVRSVQAAARRPGQAAAEAANALGPLAVKAAVWVVVEEMHRRGWGLLYDYSAGGGVGAAAALGGGGGGGGGGFNATPGGWAAPPPAPRAAPGAGAGGAWTWSGLLAAAATVAALDVLHDAWFYWAHRALHSRALYARVHALHHASAAPTPFAGYSFHVAEAALVFANEVLVCFVLPMPAALHRAYHLGTTVVHVGGHAGYEIAPYVPSFWSAAALAWAAAAWAARAAWDAARGGGAAARRRPPAPPCGALNTVRHHDMHHRHPGCHFSLYMTHWDALLGTEHPRYRDEVRRHFCAGAGAEGAGAGGDGAGAGAGGEGDKGGARLRPRRRRVG